MLSSEYFKMLDIPADSSVEDIKKAYRKKARLYHPDINHSPDAVDQFIHITEAYEFLIANQGKKLTDEQVFINVMEEWRKYRQEKSRQRAQFYARRSYSHFKNSKFYKSTRILNASSIIFNFAISVMVFIYTIAGYIIRIRNPLPGLEKPSLFSFALLLLLSIILFTVSFIYLKAYLQLRKRDRKAGCKSGRGTADTAH